jgi:cellobiose transport system substrate-binding protein
MRTTLIRGAALAGAGLLLATVAACGNSSSGGSDDPNEKVTLTVNLFGDFGYKDLYAQYSKAHPNITIKENVTDYGTHHKNLQAHLIANSGAADIEAIEIGQVTGFVAQASKMVDFTTQGVDKSQWSDWRTQLASSADGKQLFGLGTDMGGLGLCYRSDMFAAAGLPTARDDVSKLIGTWQQYFAAGTQFAAKYPDKNVKWFDSASNVYNAILAQAPKASYDESGKVIVESNADLKNAWNLTVNAVTAGQSAGIAAFTPAWNTGFAKGQFATVTCPSWMMAEIKNNAPDTKGKWDMATIPGTHGGNWGGSFLTVPKSGKHTKAAVELAKWLTAPEQEEWLFKNKGNFPSDVALWEKPDVAAYTDPFFSDAPIGKIFSESAKNLKPQPYGPHSGDIGNAIGNALVSVEQGKAKPDEAWNKALADVKNVTS